MRISTRILIFTIPLLLASFAAAQANLATDYILIDGTGSEYDMSESTTLMISGDDDVWSGGIEIGFDFDLDGQTQTYFNASTNGAMMLGTSSSLRAPSVYAYTNFEATDCPLPVVTAFFDDLVASGNGVRTQLFGSAPNRVRVVDWEAYLWYGEGFDTEYHFQVRLYEGTNKIEFWYGEMGTDDVTGSDGQIGAAISSSNYISIEVGDSPRAIGSIVYNDLSSTPIDANTLYTLIPCQKDFMIAGDLDEGGTPTMDSGAVLFNRYRSKVGNTLSVQPFTIYMGEYPCGEVTYDFILSGDAADDYSISPGAGIIGSFEDITPIVNFTPSDTGERIATLTIKGSGDFNRSYTLKASGFRCIEWVGEVADGGSPTLENGDTIFDGFQVPIGTSVDYNPIRIEQLTGDRACATPFDVMYTLNDPSGNYSITPSSETIPTGGTAMPTITFDAMNGVGYQEATLTVLADGETRSFLLRNFIAAPGGRILFGGQSVTPQTRFLRNQYTCVGESVISIELEAENIGTGNFVINDFIGYTLDTTLGQGAPPYPYVLDDFGQPVQIRDYFLSSGPGVAPRNPDLQFDSLVVPEGETRTFYLNFIPVRPGKRYANIYFSTNAFNLGARDVAGDSIQGLVAASIFARGNSPLLTDAPDMGRPASVIFDKTKVRESSMKTATLYNDGDCDLRIDADGLRFEAGDINDFEIVSVTGGFLQNGTYIVGPEQTLTITARFIPQRSGSRRATMRLITNDSSLVFPEITERGVYYWTFFGKGTFDLEARDLTLKPAVIGAEFSNGIVVLENTKLENISIEKVLITGGNGDIKMDPSNPWPSLPLILGAGEQLDLGIILNPDSAGADGMREAEILIILSNGDTTRATIRGYAGHRTLTVNPPALFQSTVVSTGEIARSFFTVTNSGTLPTVINSITITGTDAANYIILPLRRRVIEPGQTEFFEVTYSPNGPGVHSATIQVASNATNGVQTIALGGEATGTSPIGNHDPSVTVPGDDLRGESSKGSLNTTLSGAMNVQLAPNPTQGTVTIAYTLSEDSPVTCKIYGLDGRLLQTIEPGLQKAGQHELRTDLSNLPAASYFVTLEAGRSVVTRRVNVVR